MGCVSSQNDNIPANTTKKHKNNKNGKTKHWDVKTTDTTGQALLNESNMANYGGYEHKQLRHNAAETELAWINMNKTPGIQVWRIEKFKVIPWPTKRYGEFYSGDSYIILHTQKGPKNTLIYDVYFWLGSYTTQDEAGTAAYKTVELDDYLEGKCVQHREIQGNESKNFIHLFDKLTILEGGIESGFNHVIKQKYAMRLLHVTNFGHQKKMQIYQVPVSLKSINNSDCFILDNEDIIFQFNGDKANKNEKFKSMQVLNDIKQNRGKCQSYIIDGLKDKSVNALQFWGLIATFNGDTNNKDIPSINDARQDSKINPNMILTIQKISNDKGYMECTEIQRGSKLDKTCLNSKYCFIIDAGIYVYVWCGNKANKSEKRSAMSNAIKYLHNQGRDSTDKNIPITVIIEGRETKEFWNVFNGNISGGRDYMFGKWKTLFHL